MRERFNRGKKLALCALVSAISLSQSGLAQDPTTSAQDALMLRRITEYWKDGDYGTVKSQITSFLEKHPTTPLHDHLQAMLGDLYFQERNYTQALATYDLIGSAQIRDKTFFNRLQATFESRDFPAAIEHAEKHLKSNRASPLETPVRYLLAESYFRHALSCSDYEQKAHYLKLAKPHYKVLTQSKYSERILFPLAEIHRLLREDDRAVHLYLSLAEKHPEHRERFLFQSAIMQINRSKEDAEASFTKVYELGGKRSKLAAFNRLILLYQLERYTEFLTFYDEVIGSMPDQKVPLLKFYQGRCHYAMGDYEQAIMPLEEFVAEAKSRSKELKTAFLLLLNCSRYSKDIPLLERTLYSFKGAFPKDAQVPKALLIHAQMCRENGDMTQALTDLKTLITDYPGYSDQEGLMYDYALLLSQTDHWIEAREQFLGFLDKYPQSDKRTAAWRHLLNCCIEEIKNPLQESSDATKETFVSVMHKALSEDRILTDKERKQYGLIMMKCQCELGMYNELFPFLQQYIADTVDSDLLAEAHLLMAICTQKMGSDLSQFIQSAQTALAYNSALPEKDLLHLELFNAYLHKSQDAKDTEDHQHFLRQAAEHLFASETWKDRSIKLDNLLWLTDHFYKRASLGEEGAFVKADTLFSDLLGEGDDKTLNISSDSLYLEGEILKYSHLLALSGRCEERVDLLEKLAHKQQQHGGLAWKLKRRCQLELGRAYEANCQYQDALSTYNTLIRTGGRIASTINSSAKLHLAKLEYQLLSPSKKVGDSPEVVSILHALKDLQIQKKLPAEPLHLEAALEYAEIRLSLTKASEQPQNALFFYKRMFDDFHSKEDPVAEEYNHLRTSHPEKDAIFGAYMQYIDAQILRNQALVARTEDKVEKAHEYEETALRILNGLLEHEALLRPYLYDRVEEAKAELIKQL